MLLIVDTNEQATNPAVVENLRKRYDNLIITTLNAGDVNIPLDDGSVLAIERKEANDFLASIADRRIFDQVERMHKFAKYVAIVVTGKITYDKDDMIVIDGRVTPWHGNSVRGVMRVVQLSGCILEYCPAHIKYPDIIGEIYTTVNKPDERQGLKRRRIVTFPPVDPRVEALALFPGIGLKRAESLLSSDIVKGMSDEEYGSLAKALDVASTMVLIDKDIRPEGWGPKTILNFRKFLGLQSNEYICVKQDIDTPKTTEE